MAGSVVKKRNCNMYLVQSQRQRFVRKRARRGKRRGSFLVGGREDQVAAVAVLRPQQLRPHGIPSAARLPQRGRGQHRQGNPLGPDRGHGVVDEVGELSNGPCCQGQVVEQPLAVFYRSYEALK